ncbi:alpha/beta hydrolase-fold protein [Christiangramia sp.]|uniref:alpha/beta hydrolase n=1 Tax=Christiangramia sp. TaxID=1931228 RepID=UPI002615F67F|nr:alpha/beta hydrolase-fold protein [Christiangramia sp.]
MKFALSSFFLLFIYQTSFCQSTANAQVEIFSIEAPQLDTIKKIWIYLPESYSSSEKRYPVIYMHDAQNLFNRETSYAGEWKIDEVLDSLQKPETIIVGIEHGGEKRIDELTPFPHEKYGGGRGDDYMKFITSTLKPHIDTSYRTKSGSENTTIFGSSLGGLISFYAAIKYPEIFGKAGVYSPSFWFNDKIFELAENTSINTETKFYFLAGTEESEEMIPDLKKMIKILIDNGLKPENFKVNYMEGGEHNEAMWSKNFPKTYLWLMNN